MAKEVHVEDKAGERSIRIFRALAVIALGALLGSQGRDEHPPRRRRASAALGEPEAGTGLCDASRKKDCQIEA